VKAGAGHAYNTVTLETAGRLSSPQATEPDTALLLRGSASVASPEGPESRAQLVQSGPTSLIRVAQNEDHESNTQQEASPGSNPMRTSVLKVKHGEQIRNLTLARFGLGRPGGDAAGNGPTLASIEDYIEDQMGKASFESKEWHKAM
jgi:hypothetical protein